MLKFKTILFPMDDRILNMQKGWMLNGKLLPEKEQGRVLVRRRLEQYSFNDEIPLGWKIWIFLLRIVWLVLVLIPIVIPASFIAMFFKKSDKVFSWFSDAFNTIICYLVPLGLYSYVYPHRKKYRKAVFDDIPKFLDDFFVRNYIPAMYSTRWPTREEVKKIQFLKRNGYIFYFYVIKPPYGIKDLIKLQMIDIANSSFILREEDGFIEEDQDFGLTVKGRENVFYLKNEFANGYKHRAVTIFQDMWRWTSHSVYSLEHAQLSPNCVFFIGGKKKGEIEDYIEANHDELSKRYSEKGFHFVYYPQSPRFAEALRSFHIAWFRYRFPHLYGSKEEDIIALVDALHLELDTDAFYDAFIEATRLPYFRRPALLRIQSIAAKGFYHTYSVFSIGERDLKDPGQWFDYHISKVKLASGPEPSTYFQLRKKPPVYDADFYFSEEGDKISEELKAFINTISPDKFGVLAEAMLFMLEKLKTKRPDLIQKLQPYLQKAHLLEAPKKLSPVLVNEHYKIFLPGFGNQEVVMHPLPRTVYILFLRYPQGIRFKELYQHRDELLDIYNKITNRYDNDEIEQAIDDLVDMTKPSINQKCARIREAFRRIMDEPIARHYYIDGPNGEPKKIGLPERLVDIRY